MDFESSACLCILPPPRAQYCLLCCKFLVQMSGLLRLSLMPLIVLARTVSYQTPRLSTSTMPPLIRMVGPTLVNSDFLFRVPVSCLLILLLLVSGFMGQLSVRVVGFHAWRPVPLGCPAPKDSPSIHPSIHPSMMGFEHCV